LNHYLWIRFAEDGREAKLEEFILMRLSAGILFTRQLLIIITDIGSLTWTALDATAYTINQSRPGDKFLKFRREWAREQKQGRNILGGEDHPP